MSDVKILVACGLMLLLFGCISMDYRQKVERDGTSEITQAVDLTKLVSAMNGTSTGANSPGLESQMRQGCADYMQQDPTLKCTYAKGILTASKHFTPKEGNYTFTVESSLWSKKYTLIVDELPDLDVDLVSKINTSSTSNSSGSGSSTVAMRTTSSKIILTAENSSKQADSAALLATISYTIYMPGKILEAEGAVEKTESSAKFDVLERMKARKAIKVVSEEQEGTLLYLAAGLVLPLVIVGLVYYFVLRKGKKGGNGQEPGKKPVSSSAGIRTADTMKTKPVEIAKPPANPELVKYIRDSVKAGFPLMDIKNKLVESGWAEADIIAAAKDAEKQLFD